MIFGITLKHFAKLQQQGKDAKGTKRTLRLLEKPQTNRFKTRQLEELSFSDYADLKRFYANEDYINFCRIFARVKWWEVIYIHNVTAIVENYLAQSEEINEKYYYVFDPPQYGDPAKETIGSELRNDFVLEFGNDVVITEILCKGQMVHYKEIEQWKTSEVLFWANYLYGQRIVENIK
jgi:hypothetical protein